MNTFILLAFYIVIVHLYFISTLRFSENALTLFILVLDSTVLSDLPSTGVFTCISAKDALILIQEFLF